MAASLSSPASITRTGTASQTSYTGPFAIMTLLFFTWGFMTVWNDILIPRFKEAFTLSHFQANLVRFAFFGAYAVGSLIYYFISITSGDPINRIGYKNGVIRSFLWHLRLSGWTQHNCGRGRWQPASNNRFYRGGLIS